MYTYVQIQDAIDKASIWFEPLEAETYAFIERLLIELNKVERNT